MARKALLIGTGQYLEGFKPLKSAPHDVQGLKALLENPEIGGFDDVQMHLDVDSSTLATTIETWYLSHAKDDFVLLFLAGHGVKDADRRLHFAMKNTQKVGEKLITTTAIAAQSVSSWMGASRAKRQVVILNCCFSGAFGDLVPMDDGAIDVEAAIGAEGRVVMTSTSGMDYAFERLNGGELSVYGHYLTEGLRTGAAAAAENDEITIDHLHQYVSRKVQEEAPSMSPKIFAKGEGYQLRIAKVALGDPLVQYRKQVERIVQEDEGEIDEIFSRPILDEYQIKLKLDIVTALQIEDEVLEPIREYRSKLAKYYAVVKKAVQHRYPFGEREQKRLEQYRSLLALTEEDAAQILECTIERLSSQELPKPKPPEVQEPSEPSTPATEPVSAIDTIPLQSEKGVSYEKLRELLKAGKWEEADRETLRVMLEVAGQTKLRYLELEDLEKFPYADLLMIDRLWVDASKGYFGFSMQKKIWHECGSPRSMGKEWDNFCAKVGWQNADSTSYMSYSELKKNPLHSPVGELPAYVSALHLHADEEGVGALGWCYLLSRRDL
ncbi:GUN4 domain-containing protein [Alkalinema sp. FACHB-956]|uniref:caspase, EACC1-associated type n=1 Tax=Alkalinema sp. FACHB-956 TaxID=2692768 RepID=UPI001682298D|nr:GUN4 domain-containing protein [Alkalinema sp. FACHB-956]MBD2328101.1 GUN4 domain-containing protein [Alkalinema sp. FACHB-956]